MALLAEQQLIDMVTEAGEGLVATPGDPMHTAVMFKLHVAMRRLPEAAASRLSHATLAAVDKTLVYDVLERATSDVFMAFASWGTGWFPSLPSDDPDVPQRRGPGDILADIAGLAGMPTPVDEDVARALLLVATACLPENTTKIDTLDMSAATTTAVVAQLPKLQSLETLRLTGGRGCALSNAVLYPLARALHHMHRLSVVSLGQSASDNVLRVLAQACPDTLEDLDVSNSRAVTDKGVAALSSCANLKVLKLTSTSVSLLGAERALRDLAWLRDLGEIPDLGRAIAAVARGTEAVDGQELGADQTAQPISRREELEMRAFRSDRAPTLDILAEHCPRLEEFYIRLEEGGDYCRIPNLTAIANAAPNLKCIHMVCPDDGRINDVAVELLDWPEELYETTDSTEWSLSSADVRPPPPPTPRPPPPLPPPLDSVTILKLRWTPLSAWDVWAIGHTLPRLEELVLSSSPPSSSPRFLRAPAPDQRLPEDAFSRVRKLYVVDLLPDAELMILSRGFALEEACLCHWDPGAKRMSMSEDALLEALRDNPLEQLRDFSVDSAPFLGERAVQRMLECPQLKTLYTLSSWEQLAPARLEQLQADVEGRNLDIQMM